MTGGGTGQNYILLTDSTIDNLIDGEGVAIYSSGWKALIPSSSYYDKISFAKDGNNILLDYSRTGGNVTMSKLYATIRYTKTSS